MLKVLFLIGGLITLTGKANAALIHHYTFDNGTAVDSVGGANGTLFGGAAIVGGALSLNGSSAYVETIGNHIVPTDTDFTVIFFAQRTVFSGTHTELISQGLTPFGFYIGYDPSDNIRLTDAYVSTSIPFPNDGQYHNYALAKSGANAAFYIDGVFQDNFPGIQVGAGGTDTRFGRQFGTNPEYFNGNIDNIQIHDRALSPSEIARIAASGANGCDQELCYEATATTENGTSMTDFMYICLHNNGIGNGCSNFGCGSLHLFGGGPGWFNTSGNPQFGGTPFWTSWIFQSDGQFGFNIGYLQPLLGGLLITGEGQIGGVRYVINGKKVPLASCPDF